MITLDDFVMLGKTVPEEAKRTERVMVCSAGYSPTLRSLVRIYPLARRDAPEDWSINVVSLERNPDDSRMESFRLIGDRSPGAHELINRAFRRRGVVQAAARAALFHKGVFVDSIREANERRLSLAIIKPKQMRFEFEYNPESPESPELALFEVDERPKFGAKRFPYIPRLVFVDGDGTERAPMYREWGVFELMRKHDYLVGMSGAERVRYVTQAVRLDESSSLLVGNLNNQRTAWIVIKVLNGLRSQQALLDLDEAAA